MPVRVALEEARQAMEISFMLPTSIVDVIREVPDQRAVRNALSAKLFQPYLQGAAVWHFLGRLLPWPDGLGSLIALFHATKQHPQMQIQSCLLPRRERLAPVIRILPVQVAYARHLCNHTCKRLARHLVIGKRDSTSDLPTYLLWTFERNLHRNPHQNPNSAETFEPRNTERGDILYIGQRRVLRGTGSGRRPTATTTTNHDSNDHAPTTQAKRPLHLHPHLDVGTWAEGEGGTKQRSEAEGDGQAETTREIGRKESRRDGGIRARGSGNVRKPTVTTTTNPDSNDHKPSRRRRCRTRDRRRRATVGRKRRARSEGRKLRRRDQGAGTGSGRRSTAKRRPRTHNPSQDAAASPPSSRCRHLSDGRKRGRTKTDGRRRRYRTEIGGGGHRSVGNDERDRKRGEGKRTEEGSGCRKRTCSGAIQKHNTGFAPEPNLQWPQPPPRHGPSESHHAQTPIFYFIKVLSLKDVTWAKHACTSQSEPSFSWRRPNFLVLLQPAGSMPPSLHLFEARALIWSLQKHLSQSLFFHFDVDSAARNPQLRCDRMEASGWSKAEDLLDSASAAISGKLPEGSWWEFEACTQPADKAKFSKNRKSSPFAWIIYPCAKLDYRL